MGESPQQRDICSLPEDPCDKRKTNSKKPGTFEKRKMKYFALLLFLAGCASSGKTGTPYTDSAEKFMAEGRMENALEVLKNGEEKKPKNTAILLTLAELYYRIELREEAKMRYEKVLKLEDSHISHLRLSVIYEREGRLEEARNQLIQYLKTGKNPAQEIRLIDLEEKMGNYDSALVYLEKMKPELDDMKYREKKVFLFLWPGEREGRGGLVGGVGGRRGC